MNTPPGPGGGTPKAPRLIGRWLVLAGWALLLAASTGLRPLVAPDPSPLRPGQLRVALSVPEGTADVAYQRWRPAHAVGTVVFLHGSPGAGQEIAGVAEGPTPGAADLDWITIDLPGFGASTRTLPDYSARAHAAYVLALLDELEVERAHFIGFSMGGAVALELIDRAPDRVASITMLAALGVQELELLGDYGANHAVHGVQLAVVEAATALVPHFGVLDTFPLGRPYARNFYDTDQRPYRERLATYRPPMLILHGRHDMQVPVEAALEHARLVPHAELRIWEDSDHFLLFRDPDAVGGALVDFVTRVERGEAATRDNAPPAALARAALPFEPPPMTGMGAGLLAALLAVSTLLSEDAATITGGLLVGTQRLSFAAAVAGLVAGIFLGDLGIVLFGRWVGSRPVRWLSSSAVARARDLVQRHGAMAVFMSRFLPGTRVAVYFVAGVLRVPLLPFAGWLFAAAVVWTVAMVALVSRVGASAAPGAMGGPWGAVAGVVAGVVALRTVLSLTTWAGRRRWVGAFRRWTQWEFWPPYVFYPPIVLHVFGLALRHRPALVFTAANPGMPAGGFVGESKWDIYRRLGVHDPSRAGHAHLPPTERIAAGGTPEDAEAQVLAFVAQHGWPVVLKPDVGQRGDGVQVLREAAAVRTYLERAHTDLVMQAYVAGPEVGLFYVRHPDAAEGQIFSVTHKLPLDVVGDGVHDLEFLILADDRAVCLADQHLDRLRDRLREVPAAGARVRIQELGTHARGAVFADGAAVATEALRQRVEAIARDFDGGFYFGRFDVRARSLEALAAGEFSILELNGVSSEATHIYGGGLVDAWRTLAEQWRLAYAIGAANHRRGAPAAGLGDLVSAWWRYRTEIKPGHAT